MIASRATPIVIRSGEERSDVDVQLQPVRTVEVSGTLMDSSGPVPHFGVHLMPAEAGDGASVLEVATTSTDARGAFVFPLVPSGSYTLRRTTDGPGVWWRIVTPGGAADGVRSAWRVGHAAAGGRRRERRQRRC